MNVRRNLAFAGPRRGVKTLAALLLLMLSSGAGHAQSLDTSARELIERYCLDCHSGAVTESSLDLAAELIEPVEQRTATWERVLRKLTARQMPPADHARPDDAQYERLVAQLETILDSLAATQPRPGRTDSLRRLTRTEYQHAIRDLLALDIDVSELLPPDESSHGFDNVTVGELSPTLLSRYLTAAQRISALAIGSRSTPSGDTFRAPADLTQEQHVPGLPLGTRGGMLMRYTFPQDGLYDVRVRLARDRDELLEGLTAPAELEILLDRQRMQLLTIRPPATPQDHQTADSHLRARIAATAGPHELGVTFVADSAPLLETRRQPYQAHFNRHRHPRQTPAVYEVSVTGPYEPQGPGDTPSRRRIFVARPTGPEDERACADNILSVLLRRAYRRPITDADLLRPRALFREAAEQEGFEAGIELALSAMLVSPHFLLRVERQPPQLAAGTAYQVSDVELASRLSFFLWSSIPDDELLEVAERGELRRPEVLEGQVKRMLADRRAASLVTNFADQWLYLRNLAAITPDLRRFPDFDDNLRDAFRQETQWLVATIIREDRSVLDLLTADFTYLNQRLAKHYDIPYIYGSRFRRVDLPAGSARGGLLRHGSILTVTSYATRTSPVIRGHWIVKNLLGTPPPPPPANVPALSDNRVGAELTIRERLAAHRANAACASCHRLMDPVGFALENYDAVGRWRTQEAGQAVDAAGGLPDGSTFQGADGLQTALLARPELFVRTMAEKLLTFALGRGVTHEDAPAIRQVVRSAREAEYRFSAIVLALIRSPPFQMRTSE